MSRTTLALLLALATAALTAAPASAGVPPNYPGANLLPIKGVAYQPVPNNYNGATTGIYYDTDFYNADFQQLWGTDNGGRGDLKNLAADGVNFLHLYDWNANGRDHTPFVAAAGQLGIKIAVPLSNYYVTPGEDQNQVADIKKIVQQIYSDNNGNPTTTPNPAIGMITISNEPDYNNIPYTAVSQAAAYVVQAEQQIGATQLLPVSVPVSFGAYNNQPPAIYATQQVIAALEAQTGLPSNFVSTRFVAATNPQNDGTYLQGWLPQFAQMVPNTPLWFSELGTGVVLSCAGYQQPCTPSNGQQEIFNAGQWAVAVPGANNVLLGSAQFEFINELWKGEPNPNKVNDATFGVYEYSTPDNFTTGTTTPQNGSQSYPIDQLSAKPSLTAMLNAFGSSYDVSTGASGTATAARAGVHVGPEDIAHYDRATARWSKAFDGSKHGLAGNAIGAFTKTREGDLLLSLRKRQSLPGAGAVGPNDVVVYRDGRYHVLLRGSKVGLGGSDEAIDAIAWGRFHRLVLSTRGDLHAGGVSARPQDLVVFPKGSRPALYLDGSDVGLTSSSENVDGAWIDPRSDDLWLSTRGSYSVPGARSEGTDAFVCAKPPRCIYRPGFDAKAAGLSGSSLGSFAVSSSAAGARR
jgi:hypothetical protein